MKKERGKSQAPRPPHQNRTEVRGKAKSADLISSGLNQCLLSPADLPEEGEGVQMLTFRLGEEEYAVDARNVLEITPCTEVTPVPRTPPHVQGIILMRGEVVPIFDLHKRLGRSATCYNAKGYFVICAVPQGLAGIRVDRANNLVKLKKNHMETDPHPLTLLDVEKIVNIR